MNRATLTIVFRKIALASAIGAGVATTGCGVGVGAEYPGGYYDDYPPDAYIATAEPVYYGGYATYSYGGRWYYRGAGGRWGRYDREPPGFAQRRMVAAPGRRNYEPSRSVGHRSFRGGRR